MSTRVIVGDLLTGRRIVDIPWSDVKWSRLRNAPGSVSCTVPMRDPDVRALNLRNAATAGKTFLAVVEERDGGDWVAEAGQLLQPAYNRDAGSLELKANGIWSYLTGFRTVLPATARTIPVEQFLVPDPADPSKTIPNPALGTALSGWERGTIIKKLLEQALTWPGGGIPVVLPADRAGTRQKNYDGTDFKSLGAAITDLMQTDGGPDVQFSPRYQADRRGIEWLLRTGTEAEPNLRSQTIHRWDLTVTDGSIRGITVDYDASVLGDVAWSTGGGNDDAAMVERAADGYLTSLGYPLMEIVDTSRTTVSLRSTLAQYARENLARGRGVNELWKFKVRKDQRPFLGEYDVGDRCAVIIRDDPFLPDSPPTGWVREIAALDGDGGDWVTITTMEATGGG